MLFVDRFASCRRKVQSNNSNQKSSPLCKLNIAEGSSRKSTIERKRYYEIYRGLLIEIDAVTEAAFDLSYLSKEQITSLSLHLNQCFVSLSGLIK